MKGFWNLRSDEEVFKTFKVKELKFIGKFRKLANGDSIFENLRNIDYSPVLNVKSNINDNSFVRVQVINHSQFRLEQNKYYTISVEVIPQKTRIKDSSEFLLEFNDECLYEVYNPVEKEFTEQIYKKYSEANTASSQDILKSVKTITYQINKRNETFIYELLQNADDYPKENRKVTVNFYITEKYLLFTHSGIEFNFNNVYALCSVNAEDKIDDVEKIGFKGIGFKSVFKANQFVYIKSGKYSFRFDKSFHAIEYPWQLMPIWTDVEDLEISLKNNVRFLNSNVAIALRPRNISKTLNEYSKTLELFKDERILLFLRNINKVNVFINNDYRIFCDKTNNKWWLKDFDVALPDEIIRFLNDQIIEGNEEVPTKFANIARCKITFAALKEDDKISLLSDAKLYNYLPLAINLNFPFIINSDFIPDGEREGLVNNKWNEFLLIEAGKKFIKYLLVTVQNKIWDKRFCYSIINLIPSFTVISGQLENNEKWKSYLDYFRAGFNRAVLGDDENPPVAFIPTKNDKIESLENILIDETGLTDLLEEAFALLTKREKKPIHPEVGEGIEKIRTLLKEYKIGFIYTSIDAKNDFKNDSFQTWMKVPSNDYKLINHLLLHENSDIKKILETEAIILTEDNELGKANSILNNIPDTITFGKINRLNKELYNLLVASEISLPLKEFESITFFKGNIIPNKDEINQSLNNETNLKNFWHFIYDNWDVFSGENEIIKSLQQFNVLCKSAISTDCIYQTISMTYLSKEYVNEGEIESVIEKLAIEDATFISPMYLTEKRNDKEKWRKIFEKASAITDLQKVMNLLIPNIHKIHVSKHFEIVTQLFKNWKHNVLVSDDQREAIRNNLMLKCINNEFVRSNLCFISDHFNNNTLIRDTFPIIDLDNLISSDYDSKQKDIANWKKFFKEFLNTIELVEKQDILNSKLELYIKKQDEIKYKEIHLVIIKELSDLFKSRYANNFQFAKEKLSQIKLKDINNDWHVPNEMHLSSAYSPKLDLQRDAQNSQRIKFLSEEYFEKDIHKSFLIYLGINDGFKFEKTDIKRDLIPLPYRLEFETLNPTIRHNAVQWSQQHRIENHITLKYFDLITQLQYSILFWEEICKSDSSLAKLLFEETTYRYFFSPVKNNNYVVHLLKMNETLPSQINTLRKPTEYYSYSLVNYITNKEDIPLYDLSKVKNHDETKTLEDILGIQPHLSRKHCIELLSRTDQKITLKEIEDLKILEILQNYEPTQQDKDSIFFLNKNNNWKPITELCVIRDEKFDIDPSHIIHDSFIPVSNCFGIPELSEDALEVCTNPQQPTLNAEVIDFFTEKAKYIAYKLSRREFERLSADIIDKIRNYKYHEVTSIRKMFNNFKFSNITIEVGFYIKENTKEIYYTGFWKNNKPLIDFLYKIIDHENLMKPWFENVVQRWDNEDICNKLREEFGELPELLLTMNKSDNENNTEPLNKRFRNEVLGFIESMREVEDIYDEEKIEDLKSILESYKDHPQEKRKSLNLLAKLKLCKKLEIAFNEEWDFNQVISEDEKYFIHSARGAFAYIHPNEIVWMRDEAFKMAIDYGTRDIRIYNSHTEIIDLYKNHLMLYQGNPSTEEIMRICEENQMKEKFHFLIVDKEKQTDDAMAILKILNTESYE